MMQQLYRQLCQATSPLRLVGSGPRHGLSCSDSISGIMARTLGYSTSSGLVRTQRLASQRHSPYISLSVTQCGFYSTTMRRFQEDRHTKTLAVWTNLKELKASPMPALTLGLSGLAPFVAAPLYIVSTGSYMPDIAFAQLAYGASILSFIGGVRWGFVIPEENHVQANWVNLGYSIMPALIAWFGLLIPQPAGLVTVMSGLGFTAYADMAMFGYPAWFKGMRFVLSFVAILSLWSTFMCSFVMVADGAKEELE